MVGQSFAIIVLILIMSFMFLRAGKRAGMLFALPLISVSLFHLLGFAVSHIFAKSTASAAGIHVTADVTGLFTGLLFCLILSRAIGVKKLRYTYFAGCALFLTALAAAYIRYHTLWK